MNRNAYALLLLTTLIWGGNAVAGKLAVGHISPMLLTTGRWVFALAILLGIGWKQLAIDWQAVRKNLWLLGGLGALGFTGFNVALYSALTYTSAINTSIEQAGIPMVIFVLNFLLFRVHVRIGQIVGFLLSIAGVALTASHGDPARLLHLDVNFGDALMIVAVIVYSLYTVGLRFKPDIHWQSLMIALTGTAALTSLPFALAEQLAGAAIYPDLRGWGIVAFTVLFPSILAQLFYVKAVEMIGANRAGLFINLVPVFGTLLSVLILREDFQLYHGAAMVMVLGGIWIAERSGAKP
jgi:drug/metabolite transporter (DMT)-like permease